MKFNLPKMSQSSPGSNPVGDNNFRPYCGEGSDTLFWTPHNLKPTPYKF